MKKKNIMAVVLSFTCMFSMPVTVHAERTNVACPAVQISGEVVCLSGPAKLDLSNVAEGYIVAGYYGDCPKVKLQITGQDNNTYTYDLHGGDEVFSLSAGNGEYLVSIYENIEGNRYTAVLKQPIYVEITNLFGPYLYPNQYANFHPDSETVKMAGQLSVSAQTDLEVVSNIYNYIKDNIIYDYEKASSVESGYLPDVDVILANKKGICLDYASLMVSMLRSQGIPARIDVGYVDGAYHAWVNVYVQEEGWINGVIRFDGSNWTLMDPTFAAVSEDVALQGFIGDGSGYQTRFIY